MGLSISFDRRVTLPPEVLIRELDGESVILNLNSEQYFGLDEIGTRMWQVLMQSDSIQFAYETLLVEYEVEAEQLRSDLHNLIEKLVEYGLLELDGESQS